MKLKQGHKFRQKSVKRAEISPKSFRFAAGKGKVPRFWRRALGLSRFSPGTHLSVTVTIGIDVNGS